MASLTVQSSGWNTLPQSSRVWIYQPSRTLTDAEADVTIQALDSFMNSWNTHGTQLVAGYQLIENTFLILAVDEAHQHASGCSIDSSVAVLKKLNQEFGLDFFDRMSVVFKDGDGLKRVQLAEFTRGLEEGVYSRETLVFNNLVKTKGEFEESWETTVANSWHTQLVK